MIQRICVFCGSSDGAKPEYLDAATELGKQLAATNIGLVYGGASVGLMGAVADAVLAAGGEVTGVMPRSLVEREVAHSKLRDLRVVGSMHERKALMTELADAFIALPGGLGTLEEFFEVWTWAQLGEHTKPLGMLNVAGYYDPCSCSLTTWSTSASSAPSIAPWCWWNKMVRSCFHGSPTTGLP